MAQSLSRRVGSQPEGQFETALAIESIDRTLRKVAALIAGNQAW